MTRRNNRLCRSWVWADRRTRIGIRNQESALRNSPIVDRNTNSVIRCRRCWRSLRRRKFVGVHFLRDRNPKCDPRDRWNRISHPPHSPFLDLGPRIPRPSRNCWRAMDARTSIFRIRRPLRSQNYYRKKTAHIAKSRRFRLLRNPGNHTAWSRSLGRILRNRMNWRHRRSRTSWFRLRASCPHIRRRSVPSRRNYSFRRHWCHPWKRCYPTKTVHCRMRTTMLRASYCRARLRRTGSRDRVGRRILRTRPSHNRSFHCRRNWSRLRRSLSPSANRRYPFRRKNSRESLRRMGYPNRPSQGRSPKPHSHLRRTIPSCSRKNCSRKKKGNWRPSRLCRSLPSHCPASWKLRRPSRESIRSRRQYLQFGRT